MDAQTQEQIFRLGADVIQNVVVPEIMNYVRAHQAANNGALPTDAEVFAALKLDTDAGITTGEAFLATEGEKI